MPHSYRSGADVGLDEGREQGSDRADDHQRRADRNADDTRHGDPPLRAAQHAHRVVEGQVGDHESARWRLEADAAVVRRATGERRRAGGRSRRGCATTDRATVAGPCRSTSRATVEACGSSSTAGSPRQTFGMTTSGSAAAAGSTVSEPSWSHSSNERVSRRRSTLRQLPPAMTSTSRWNATRRSPSPRSGEDPGTGSARPSGPHDPAGRPHRAESDTGSRAARPAASPKAGWAPAIRSASDCGREGTDAEEGDESEEQRRRHRQPAEVLGEVDDGATTRADQVFGPQREHGIRQAGGRPHDLVRLQVAVDDDRGLRRVAERRDAADRESGRGPRLVTVGAPRARSAGGTRQLVQVDAVRAGDEGDDRRDRRPGTRGTSRSVRPRTRRLAPRRPPSECPPESAEPRSRGLGIAARGDDARRRSGASPILGARARLAGQPKRRQGSATALRVRRRTSQTLEPDPGHAGEGSRCSAAARLRTVDPTEGGAPFVVLADRNRWRNR